MPEFLCEPITENNAWTVADLKGRESWTRNLTSAMIDEVMRAVKAVGDTPFRKITTENIPLPSMAEFLNELHDDLDNGLAFAVLAGWPVDEFDYRDNVAAYCAISAHIGDIVVQNYEGQSVVDVIDEDVAYSHLSRGYRSNKRLPFHTDGANLTGLLCLGGSTSGGGSLLVSATTVFNTILTEKPEYLDVLERGFFHHRRGQHDEGENPLSAAPIPVFTFHDGYLHCCYNRNPIDWVEKEGMTLSDKEVEILDYFDAIVARPDLQAKLQIQKGDMQFFNNFVVLHSRTEYQDDADHRRHLVRLWLEDPRSKRRGESLLDLYVPGSSRFHAVE